MTIKTQNMTVRLIKAFMACCLLAVAQGRAATNESSRLPDSGLSSLNVALLASKDHMDDSVKLGPGDVVSMIVVEDRDDARRLMIGDTGDLDFPYIGRLKATGKTCKSLAMEAKAVLEKEFYYQATVIIGIDSLFKKSLGKIYVLGAVPAPGEQEIPSDSTYTVAKAILKAGGFTQFSDRKRVKVTRQVGADSATTETFFVNIIDIWEKGKLDLDRPVQAGDMIYVGKKVINF